MTETITLRGYAVPFGQTAHIGDGVLEQFAPSAFSEMLSRHRNAIALRWGSHEDGAPELANTSARSLSFFEDEYGLGFFAVINFNSNWSRVAAMVRRRNPVARCSIGGLEIKASRRERLQVGMTRIVTAATIDHLIICDSAAAYQGTAAWPAHHPLDYAPLKIQDLAARWEQGRAAWNQRLAPKPSAITSLIESRRAELMRIRAAVAANPSAFSGQVFMHTAFSKAADKILGRSR